MFLRTLTPQNFARLYVKFTFNRLKSTGKFDESNLTRILMRSLNLWLNLRRGILKFRSAVCWLNLKIQRAMCHLRAIKTENA